MNRFLPLDAAQHAGDCDYRHFACIGDRTDIEHIQTGFKIVMKKDGKQHAVGKAVAISTAIAIALMAAPIVVISTLYRLYPLLPSPEIGTVLPHFMPPILGAYARDFDSKQMHGKPYLINVWATWCTPCKNEHPDVMRLARSKRVRIIGYNWNDEPAKALKWLRDHGNPYELSVTEKGTQVSDALKIRGTPHHILVDGASVIRWIRSRNLGEDLLVDELLPALAAFERSP